MRKRKSMGITIPMAIAHGFVFPGDDPSEVLAPVGAKEFVPEGLENAPTVLDGDKAEVCADFN